MADSKPVKADRQTDRQIDRQTDRQTVRQTDRQPGSLGTRPSLAEEEGLVNLHTYKFEVRGISVR